MNILKKTADIFISVLLWVGEILMVLLLAGAYCVITFFSWIKKRFVKEKQYAEYVET